MSKGSAIFGWARLLAPIILANIPQTRRIADKVAQGMDDAEAIHDAPGAEKLQYVIAIGHDSADAINAERPGTVNKDQLDVAISGGVNAAFAAAKVIADAHGHPQAANVTLASQLQESGYSAPPGTDKVAPGEAAAPVEAEAVPPAPPAPPAPVEPPHPAPGGDTHPSTSDTHAVTAAESEGLPPAQEPLSSPAQAPAATSQPAQQPPAGAPSEVATESAGATGNAEEAPAGAGSGTVPAATPATSDPLHGDDVLKGSGEPAVPPAF